MILTYTSLTMKDILDLTFPQFKNTVDGVMRKVNWEYKLAIASVAPDALSEKDFPFHSNDNEDRVFTMKDAQALQNLANS